MQAATEQYPILRVDESHDDLLALERLQEYDEAYDRSYASWGEWILEADDDLAYYLGDQWSAADKQHLDANKRARLVFNKIRRILKMIEGFERRTRVSLIANSQGTEDDKLMDQYTKMLIWQMNIARMHMTMSEAFAGALKTGMNLVQLSMVYDDDPLSGDIALNRLAHNQYLLDPRMTKRDLSDCEYIIQRRHMSREAVKLLLPWRDEEINMIRPTGSDDKFPFIPASREWQKKDLLRFDEFWTRRSKDIEILLDMESGKMQEWDGEREVLQRLLSMSPRDRRLLGLPGKLNLLKRKKKTVELNVFVERQLMYSGPNPWGMDDFPHIPIITFWDPEYAATNSDQSYALKMQGIIRSLRDSQTEINKRRSKALDIMDSSVHSGWKVRENSVVNRNDLYRSGNNSVVWVKKGAQMTDVEKIQPAEIPTTLLAMTELFDKDLMEIAGATNELLGMPENENMPISGVLAKVRQGAGLTILQDIFDNYRYSQEMLGKKLIQIMQINFHKSKVERVVKEEMHERFKDLSTTKFDIQVEESIETPAQKNLFYMQLLQARQLGINIPDSLLIESMPIQNKDKLYAALKQQEDAAAQQAQIEAQQRQTLNELSQAKIVSDVGLGVERLARSRADVALARERIAESQQNQADAVLSRVKALVEMAQLEDDQKLKWMEFLHQREVDLHQAAQVDLQQDNVEQGNVTAAGLQKVMGK
jgi:hypothetical protein